MNEPTNTKNWKGHPRGSEEKYGRELGGRTLKKISICSRKYPREKE
jgi:hypothetical protein